MTQTDRAGIVTDPRLLSRSFPAYVLVCPDGHREVTSGKPARRGPDTYCSFCGGELVLSRQITVVPGRRHSDMGCHQ